MFKNIKTRIKDWMYPKERTNSDQIYNLLFGKTDNISANEELATVCGMDFAKRPVQVAVIRVGDDACNPVMLDMIIKSCSNSSDSDEVLPVSDGCNQVILIFFNDTIWEDQVCECLEELQKEFEQAFPDTKLYITLGTVENYSEKDEPAWRRSYKTATGLQDYRYIKTKGKIITYSDIISRRKLYPKGIDFRFDLLKEYLESDNPGLLNGWLSGIYSMFLGNGTYTMGICYHLTLEIVVNTVSLLREKGLSAEKHIGIPDEIIGNVLSINNPIGLQKWVGELLENCRGIIRQPHLTI